MIHFGYSLNSTAYRDGGSLPHDGADAVLLREAHLRSDCVTSRNAGVANPNLLSSQLVRKQHLLKKILFAKSTVHAKPTPKNPCYGSSFPTSVCPSSSRIPYWDALTLDAGVKALIKGVMQ